MRRVIALLISTGMILAGSAAVTSAYAGVVEREAMLWHMQSGNPPGTPVGERAEAQLVRTGSGISWSIRTEQLKPGHSYTVWTVVINNPSACQTPNQCVPNPDVLVNFAATQSQVVYGGGHVVGGSGQAGFGGRLATGPIPNGWFEGQGLTNPLGAEVHFVLNDHGPVIPALLPEMIKTYRAGCTDASLPAIFPDSAKADGTPGPNACVLTQFVMFR